MGKPDIFSRSYENLDQELKNACLKYEQAQSRKGLKVSKISIVYTPDARPYFNIEVDEGAKIKKAKPDPAPAQKTLRFVKKTCNHPSTLCNGLGKLECLLCDKSMGDCEDPMCDRCSDEADAPPTLRSARLPFVAPDEEDEEDVG